MILLLCVLYLYGFEYQMKYEDYKERMNEYRTTVKSSITSYGESVKNVFSWRRKNDTSIASSPQSSSTPSIFRVIGVTGAVSIGGYAMYKCAKYLYQRKKSAKPQDHIMFKTYPLHSTFNLSSGESVTIPYHVYNANAMYIVGTADLRCIQQLMDNQCNGPNMYEPVVTDDGRAVVLIWILDYLESNIGPHKALQISFLVSDKRASKQIHMSQMNSYAFANVLSNPEVKLFCHGLWLDKEIARDYYNEILGHKGGLAYSSTNGFTQTAKEKNFKFIDKSSGQIILKGASYNGYSSIFEYLTMPTKMLLATGIRSAIKLGLDPTISVQVVNSNMDHSLSFTVASMHAARAFNNKLDYILFEEDISCHSRAYAQMDFQGLFVQHCSDFKRVHLNPHNQGHHQV